MCLDTQMIKTKQQHRNYQSKDMLDKIVLDYQNILWKLLLTVNKMTLCLKSSWHGLSYIVRLIS